MYKVREHQKHYLKLSCYFIIIEEEKVSEIPEPKNTYGAIEVEKDAIKFVIADIELSEFNNNFALVGQY